MEHGSVDPESAASGGEEGLEKVRSLGVRGGNEVSEEGRQK